MSRAVTDEELAALVRRVTEAADALIRGDVESHAARIKHADDYTLMPPHGGDPVRGFDDSDEALEALAKFFRGGKASVEVVETYTSGDLAVLAVIERQHGTIGDLPEQDWSLRVSGSSDALRNRTGSSCIAMRTRSRMPSTTSGWER